MAILRVIVHYTDRLHKRITNGRAHEAEPALLQILAHGVRFRGSRRNVARTFQPRLLGFPADELPDVFIEAAEFFPHGQKAFSVVDRRRYLPSVAHDPSVSKERSNFLRVIACDFRGVKIIERFSVILALVQNCGPAQSRLRAFEYQKLEQQPVIVHRYAPFLIVIRLHRWTDSPVASPHFALRISAHH